MSREPQRPEGPAKESELDAQELEDLEAPTIMGPIQVSTTWIISVSVAIT